MRDDSRCRSGGCRRSAGGEECPRRRELLKRAVGVGLGLVLARRGSFAQEDPASRRPSPGDLLVAVDAADRTPLVPSDIGTTAAPTMVWAMDPADGTVRNGSRLNRVLLLRFDPETLAPDTRLRAADGVIAYTAICTHHGCEVTGWGADRRVLHCPCHVSSFDPRDGARVLDGPAPRALPALPLAVDDEGRLVVAGPFTTRVGFEQA